MLARVVSAREDASCLSDAMKPSTPIEDSVLTEIVRRLVDSFHPDRVYLFGSRARGDANNDSDYDILLVLPRLEDRRYRLSQRAYALLRGIPAAVDVLVWSKEDFDSRLDTPASLPATVEREGRLLHAA